MIGVGIGLPFYRSFGSGVDAQAQAHFNRVIADGGVVPSGLSGVNAFFSAVKAIYGTTDINTAISAAYDAHYLGYKLGAGSGTTLGQAAQKLYAPKGIFGGIGTGSAFWEGVGVSSNFISTPNAAANQITGDIEIVVNASFDNLGTTYFLCSKIAGPSNYAYEFTRDSSNRLLFSFSTTGSNQINVQSTVIQPFAIGVSGWLKVIRNSTTGDVTFSTSTNGITYTQLGAVVNSTTGSMFAGTRTLGIGGSSAGSGVLLGRIFRLTIANSIGGTPVVDFNANQYTGANTWTSTTSEVWTVNSTGAGLADVTQTTAASQPLLLAHTGENYYYSGATSGNYVSTPDSVNATFSGDLDVRIRIKNFVNNQTQVYVTKRTSSGFVFYSDNFGILNLEPWNVLSTAPVANGFNGWLRMTKTSTEIKFFTGTDSDTPTFTQLGTTITGSFTNPSTNANILGIGGVYNTSTLTYFPTYCKILRVTKANSIGGTPVVDFNPASYNPSVSQTQWTSATGEVWSISTGTATSGYKGVLVDRTIVQGDGVDDGMRTSGNLPAWNTDKLTLYSVNRLLNNSDTPLVELSNDWNSNSKTFLYGTGTNRVSVLGSRGVGGNIYNLYSIPANLTFRLLTFTDNHSLTPATSEINVYINNSLQTKTQVAATDQTFVYDTPYPLNILGRNAGASLSSNAILTTCIMSIIEDNTTQRTAMYNAIKGYNNNAF